jgi:hypothetical protein
MGFSNRSINGCAKEHTPVANKTGKANEKNPKRLSKGKRTHARRLKQEGRKSGATPRA